MAKKTLTARGVARIKPPETGQIDVFDKALPGFALRVAASGRRSWVLFYRVQAGPFKGKLRRFTIGTFPALGLMDARAKAQEAMRNVSEGGDPAHEKQIERKRGPETPDSVQNVVAEFIEKYAKVHTKSWKQADRVFRLYVIPAWGSRPIKSITRADVIALLDTLMEDGKPYQANRTLAFVRKFFNWAISRDILQSSPVAKVEAPGKEVKRDRVLTDLEIKDLWSACDRIGSPFGSFIKTLLATGQRRDEVSHMKWADLDLENGLWTLPRTVTKSDRAHTVPLSPLVTKILSGLPEIGDYVFMSGRAGDRPISGYGVAKKRIDKAIDNVRNEVDENAAPVSPWRFHDLRRTAASGMAKLDVAPHVLSKILNHASDGIQGVTAIYNRYGYDQEKRHALNTWAQHIDHLVAPPADKVVSITAAKMERRISGSE